MRGVLLVDMNYSTIEQMMERVNSSNSYQYFYLCDSDGELIYHPRQMRISVGNYKENNLQVCDYEDGVHEEKFNGERRLVIVNTISYTGWQLHRVEAGLCHSHERFSARQCQYPYLYFDGDPGYDPGPFSGQQSCYKTDHKPDPAAQPLDPEHGGRQGRS